MNCRCATVKKDVLKRADCLRFLPTLDAGSVDLVVADPPYNIGVAYDAHHDAMHDREYAEWCWRWLRECERVLRPGGSMYLIINDENAAQMQAKFAMLRMVWRNTIIWAFEFGQHLSSKFGRNHVQILYYSKPGPIYFEPQRVPSKRQTVYGDKRAHKAGRVPGDVWMYPRVCGTFKRKVKGVPNQIPVELLQRIIVASCPAGGTVCDPFLGSGSTAIAAKLFGRRFVGCEISSKAHKLAVARFRKGTE